MPTVLKNIASRAMQVHGSLGPSDEMPFVKMIINGTTWGWPTVRPRSTSSPWPASCCADYRGTDGMWPTEWIPGKLEAAKAKFAEFMELEVGNL